MHSLENHSLIHTKKRQKAAVPVFRPKCRKNYAILFGATNTYKANIRDYRPGKIPMQSHYAKAPALC